MQASQARGSGFDSINFIPLNTYVYPAGAGAGAPEYNNRRGVEGRVKYVRPGRDVAGRSIFSYDVQVGGTAPSPALPLQSSCVTREDV